jgi:hypothetical protein
MPKKDSDHNTTPEGRVIARLERVEARLRDLEVERQALQRILTDFRKDDPRKRESGRKRSIRKAVIEEKILAMLRSSPRGLSSGQVQQRLEDGDDTINYNTVRSYVRRLSIRGLIIAAPGGRWRAAG